MFPHNKVGILMFLCRTLLLNRTMSPQSMDGSHTMQPRKPLLVLMQNSITSSEKGHCRRWVIFGFKQITWSVFMALGSFLPGMVLTNL